MFLKISESLFSNRLCAGGGQISQRTRSLLSGKGSSTVFKRTHCGLIAFSDYGLDSVPAGRKLHIRLEGESMIKHGEIAGLVQVEFHLLRGTFHVLAFSSYTITTR